jgi:hypothetical protein
MVAEFTPPLAKEGFGGGDANCALSRPMLLLAGVLRDSARTGAARTMWEECEVFSLDWKRSPCDNRPRASGLPPGRSPAWVAEERSNRLGDGSDAYCGLTRSKVSATPPRILAPPVGGRHG